MTSEQRETLDAILRQSAFPADSDVEEQRRLLRELLSAQPLPAGVMDEDERGAFERPADPALVRSELLDGFRVPVAHVEPLVAAASTALMGAPAGRSHG